MVQSSPVASPSAADDNAAPVLPERLDWLESRSLQLEPSEEQMSRMTDDVVQFGKSYHSQVEASRIPAFEPFSPHNVADGIVKEGLPEDATPEEWPHIFEMVQRDMIVPGMNFSSPTMFGYVPGGGIYPSALADYIAAVTNRFSAMFFASPGAVKVENMLIRWAATELEMGDVEGISGSLTSGGSLATLSALVCAREHHRVLIGGADGNTPATKFVMYKTDQTHSCVVKALHLIGCGHVIVRDVPRDEFLRMRSNAFAKLVADDLAAGLIPWTVVATAGTTNSGSVDPINEIGPIAQAHNIWMHVDGAYGGLMNLCPEAKQRFGGGFRYADSLICDPHKSLFLPFGTGMLLVRDGKLLKETHAVHAEYLERFIDNEEETSSADVSSELSKHYRALRLYMPLRIFGIGAFRDAQSEKIMLARYFNQQMREDERFVVFTPPDLSITMYRMRGNNNTTVGSEAEDITLANARTHKLINIVMDHKWVFVSGTTIDGVFWLRLCVGVFRTHRRHIEEAMETMKTIAGQVLAEEQR